MIDWFMTYHQWFGDQPLVLQVMMGLTGLASVIVIGLCFPSWFAWWKKKIKALEESASRYDNDDDDDFFS